MWQQLHIEEPHARIDPCVGIVNRVSLKSHLVVGAQIVMVLSLAFESDGPLTGHPEKDLGLKQSLQQLS